MKILLASELGSRLSEILLHLPLAAPNFESFWSAIFGNISLVFRRIFIGDLALVFRDENSFLTTLRLILTGPDEVGLLGRLAPGSSEFLPSLKMLKSLRLGFDVWIIEKFLVL